MSFAHMETNKFLMAIYDLQFLMILEYKNPVVSREVMHMLQIIFYFVIYSLYF
jgi:hypothetical protein